MEVFHSNPKQFGSSKFGHSTSLMKIQPYLLLSMAAAVIYGFANPMMGQAQRMGLSLSRTIFSSALGGLAVGLIYWSRSNDVLSAAPTGAYLLAASVGALWTIAMLMWTRALAPDMNSTASSVFLVVGTNPLIATLISLVAFKEYDKIVLWKLGAGGILIAAGLYFITTCHKAAENPQ